MGGACWPPIPDLDLLFLRPWKSTPAHRDRSIEFMLYVLWDLGLKVGSVGAVGR